jgi:hypothetical protein
VTCSLMALPLPAPLEHLRLVRRRLSQAADEYEFIHAYALARRMAATGAEVLGKPMDHEGLDAVLDCVRPARDHAVPPGGWLVTPPEKDPAPTTSAGQWQWRQWPLRLGDEVVVMPVQVLPNPIGNFKHTLSLHTVAEHMGTKQSPGAIFSPSNKPLWDFLEQMGLPKEQVLPSRRARIARGCDMEAQDPPVATRSFTGTPWLAVSYIAYKLSRGNQAKAVVTAAMDLLRALSKGAEDRFVIKARGRAMEVVSLQIDASSLTWWLTELLPGEAPRALRDEFDRGAKVSLYTCLSILAQAPGSGTEIGSSLLKGFCRDVALSIERGMDALLGQPDPSMASPRDRGSLVGDMHRFMSINAFLAQGSGFGKLDELRMAALCSSRSRDYAVYLSQEVTASYTVAVKEMLANQMHSSKAFIVGDVVSFDMSRVSCLEVRGWISYTFRLAAR